MSDLADEPLRNRIPFRLLKTEPLLCQWLYTDGRRFEEPFFDETIARCRRHAYNSAAVKSVSSLESLAEFAAGADALPPAAFIFHVSRCGSTLLSQLLGLWPSTIVLSEVPFLDELLRLPLHYAHVPDEVRLAAFQATIKLMGRRVHGHERHMFVKLDSWHIAFAPLLRQLYPEAPFILLYRRPAEVVRSHSKNRGMHAVPGVLEEAVTKVPVTKKMCADLDQYTAAVLEKQLHEFLDIAATDHNYLLLNYAQGYEALMQQTAAATGLELTADLQEKINHRCRFHAKFPDRVFAEPALEGQLPKWLQPAQKAYLELEALRVANPVPANGLGADV